MVEIPTGLSIGEVAGRTGLSVHALRFYERQGLLAGPIRRDAGGRRVYSADDVDWLHLCIRFRSSGMPLETIRAYTELVRQGPGNEEDRLAVLRRHQEHVTAQLRALTECLDVITHKVELYQRRLAGGAAECE
jgi:DNA-binding transcriptional MerR regulator